MKRTVEIEDDLDERIADIREDMKNDFIDFLKDNKDIVEFDDYYQQQGTDNIHEIVDSSTPIHYSNIDDLYYLYGDEFEEAYKNAGIGSSDENNHKQVAIYCYLEEQAHDYLRELEEIFECNIDDGIDELIKVLEAIE